MVCGEGDQLSKEQLVQPHCAVAQIPSSGVLQELIAPLLDRGFRSFGWLFAFHFPSTYDFLGSIPIAKFQGLADPPAIFVTVDPDRTLTAILKS